MFLCFWYLFWYFCYGGTFLLVSMKVEHILTLDNFSKNQASVYSKEHEINVIPRIVPVARTDYSLKALFYTCFRSWRVSRLVNTLIRAIMITQLFLIFHLVTISQISRHETQAEILERSWQRNSIRSKYFTKRDRVLTSQVVNRD